jgi:Carboxypeptidase regulatory-like domain/TonB dependent receptor
MRQVYALLFATLSSVALFAQSDRGTVTGTISDPAGAVIAGAPITLKNSATGASYDAASTATGNYTIPQVPAGTYEMSVTVQGFKKYVRQNIDVQVAQTLRLDVPLEVGASSESVTVSAEVTLLKTESGEMSHNVDTSRVNNLPIMTTGAASGSSGIRNPQAVALLVPGTYVSQNSNLRVNGSPGNTASYRVEGQDATNGQVPATQAQTQPSVDAIQEVSIQTSNFAAEYGQVGGGFFNYTMKSGTNRYHGSAYDYFVNEKLNAATPWVNVKNIARRNNYGFTFGGPIAIPGVYDGHDKSFFFVNFEQYRENQNINTQNLTLPTAAYRNGDFSAVRLTRNLGTDPLGNAIIEGTIYDPATTRSTAAGQRVRDAFAGNLIPLSRMDPVALKIQSLIPATNRAGFLTSTVNNSVFPYQSQRVTTIPAFKIDHNLSSKMKLAYYWSQTKTASQYSPSLGASDGLPLPITSAIGTFITARVQRLNFDYTMTPTVLLHIGGGFQSNNFADDAPVLDYNQEAALGLKGATVQRLFPALRGLTAAQGGVKDLGPLGNRHPLLYNKPTGNASLTWVKDNHTYKFGGEMRLDSNASTLFTNTNGIYNFSAAQTGQPYLQATAVGGGNIGFPYASFLLGAVDNVRIAPSHEIKLAKSQVGFFAQDTWKATRKLTLDYGLRYDYSTYLKETSGKLAQFSPVTPNAAAGGIPGAVIFEGDGAGRCNCNFAKNYPWAFGPRLGLAYQINSKTVLRAGLGVVFAGTTDSNGATQGNLTLPQAVSSSNYGDAVVNFASGIPSSLVDPFPNYNANQFPQTGYHTTQAPPTWYDQNAGRPARQIQWSFGLQREIVSNLVVEASYVGNRGAWWYAPGLIDVNGLTPERIASVGLNVTNTADQAILRARIGDAAAGAFRNRLPYSAFPTTATVAQSLRPFPQFSSITSLWAPLGRTWYDSLQMKATKRMSRGLDFTSVFTWQRNLLMGSPNNPVVGAGNGGAAINDVFNRKLNKALSPFDQPIVFNIAVTYQMPKFVDGSTFATKALSQVARDWTFNAFLAYSSGIPILAPTAQNNLNNLLLRNNTGATTGYANRVEGQPVYLKDPNCRCYDPTKEFILNKAAWADPAPGTFGNAAAYYNDYRAQRRPQESFSFGRIFRFTERVNFNVRAEFSNIFNRSVVPTPAAANLSNANLAQTITNGVATAGFGFTNTSVAPAIPTSRQGTIVGRLTF